MEIPFQKRKTAMEFLSVVGTLLLLMVTPMSRYPEQFTDTAPHPSGVSCRFQSSIKRVIDVSVDQQVSFDTAIDVVNADRMGDVSDVCAYVTFDEAQQVGDIVAYFHGDFRVEVKKWKVSQGVVWNNHEVGANPITRTMFWYTISSIKKSPPA
jgi:hypothetical protein